MGEDKVAPPGLGEAALRALFDVAFDALVITHGGTIVFANRSFVEMAGTPADKIIGSSVLDFVAPECLELVKTQMSKPAETRYEAIGLRPDGARIDVEVCAHSGMYDGKPARISAIRYITERKRAEQTLRRSEARFRRLIERIQDIIVVEREGVVVFANTAALRYLGYADLGEITGAQALELVHPGDRESVRARWAEAHDDTSSPLVIARIVRRDGSIGTVEIATAAMEELDGARATVVLARDVSERQHTEAQLVQIDLLSSIGMLAAGIAHAINNPLAYATLNLGVMARKLAALRATVGTWDPERSEGADPEASRRALALCREIEDLLGITINGADRVQEIVRDVRVFARGGEGKTPVDLPQVLDSTIQLALNSIRHRARLVREYECVPLVDADEPRLGQLFLNLLINALQAFDDGPRATDEIRVRTGTAPSGAAIVEITDTGCGIAADVLGRVFEPFFTTKAPGVGTGLGLPICRSIVSSLGGTIEVESTLGHGTTCRVTLPAITPSATQTASANGQRGAAVPQRLRVLVVEDEPMLLRTLGEELGHDHDVTSTACGEEAISLVLRESFDVVLCDVMMPAPSGIDVYNALRRHRPGRERTVVFMTGGAFTPAARDFLASVPNTTLEKPFTYEELLRAIVSHAGVA